SAQRRGSGHLRLGCPEIASRLVDVVVPPIRIENDPAARQLAEPQGLRNVAEDFGMAAGCIEPADVIGAGAAPSIDVIEFLAWVPDRLETGNLQHLRDPILEFEILSGSHVRIAPDAIEDVTPEAGARMKQVLLGAREHAVAQYQASVGLEE